MAKFVSEAERILLGESLASVASTFRHDLLVDMGFDPDDCPDDLFRKETMRFMNDLCRHLGDNHAEDGRIVAALRAWIQVVEEYDAFDALLSNFEFDGKEAAMRRGRVLFPGPLTAHWGED